MKSLFSTLLLATAAPKEVTTLADLRRDNSSPKNLSVQAFETCTTSINRLKKGPALWDEIIAKGDKYEDKSFEGRSSLYWALNLDFEMAWQVEGPLLTGQYKWERLGEKYPSADLWTTNPSFVDITQGIAGNCYFIASISALAEHPDYIKGNFYTQTTNGAGIYALKFYIRGKPWIVTIDDRVLVDSDGDLVFGGAGPNTQLWGPILEKAWAKIQGSYGNSGNGGYFTMGIEAMLGVPVFNYITKEQNDESERVWNLIQGASALNYIVGTGTEGGSGSDQEQNSYGVHLNHQYALIEAFTLSDGSGNVQHRMFMARNPWGSTDYTGPWKHDDSRWTAAYIAQVPHGVNPTTSNQQGIFFVEDTDFLKVFDDFQIAHVRSGYSNDMYDKDFDWDLWKTFHVDVPAKSGDLYVKVDSYYGNMVPPPCHLWINRHVTLTVTVGDREKTYEQKYFDSFTQPILIPEADYNAGEKLKAVVSIEWLLYPEFARDYTLTVFSNQDLQVLDAQDKTNICHMDGTWPSCFTESSYHVATTSPHSEPSDSTPRSLWEVYLWAYNWDSFWKLLGENWWTLFWWF